MTESFNNTVQRTGASRFAQRQIERHRRLAPVAELGSLGGIGCPVHIVTDLMFALPLVLAGGCSTGVPPLQAASTYQPSAAIINSGSIPLVALEPATGSVPARPKDEHYRRVTGDYAYADLEAVLRLVGRIRGADREALQVRFFERIAAAATVGHTFSGTVYLCSKDTEGVWQVVGRRDYVH